MTFDITSEHIENIMNFCQYADLKDFCKQIPLIVLPSTLWSIHIDPDYQYVIVVHIQMKSLSRLNIDKGILLTMNAIEKTISTSFFIQNEVINIPKLNNCIKSISDLSQLVYVMHNLKICPNAERQTENSNCNRYIDDYNRFCSSCRVWIKLSCDELPTATDVDSDLYSMENPVRENVEHNSTEIVADNWKRPYSCEFCEKTFLAQTHLKEHVRLHTEEKPYICTICSKTSSRQSVHIKHVQTHSNEKKPYLCNICGKTFCQAYRMKQHLLTHSLERPFECNVCNKKFAKNYNLKLHQRTHSGVRSFICSTCGKTYTTHSNLKTHVRSSHTNEKPHACSNCNMTFVHPRYLRIHMRKHTGEKPYTCMICGKCFSKNIHLTVHIRIHTGEKPHLCTQCGKGFTTTGNLNSHKRIHHKDLDI